MRKFLCILLALVMVLSLAACGKEETAEDTGKASEATEATEPEDTSADDAGEDEPVEEADYDTVSAEIYDAQMGEFYEAYQKALACENVSERYALMAIAEAKLMESAVMLPTSTRGGNYAISRVAPYTVDWTLWGNDSDRFYRALVATEPLTSEDRAEMKAKWGELRSTGTYYQWAKDFLTEKGYEIKDTYTLTYNSDPETWDALATSRAADSEAIVNTYDGLMEYDVEGYLQPALAESYTVSDDGLVYTFTLREGLKWVDSQGREVAPVVADDFVAGMQHMMDAMGGLEYLVGSEGCNIKGADAYINNEITDFEEVGVKAVDERTVEYTLEAPCSFFITMLGYNVFAPMSRTYFESQGGAFGEEYDSGAETYTYGKDPNSIAYCGPYVVTNATANNTIVFKANESYWNPDAVAVKTLTWLFNDGSDVTKAYNDMKAGTIDGCGLNASSLEIAKEDGLFDQFGYISATDATSYMAFYNMNRGIFANVNNDTSCVSEQTEEQSAATKLALQNVHFRRAVSFAVDRAAYNAQSVGEELKLTSLRNSYTPWNFVSLEEEVTVDINGTAKTYPVGTFYGVIMQDQIDADGVSMIVYDPNADDGAGNGDGFDGWYNVENAVAELDIAIEELAEEGVTIDEENPILLDLPYPSNSEVYTNKCVAFQKSVEDALGGKVKVMLTECVDYDEWYYAGYYTDFGYEANYDIYDLSGWGPDYGDPATYLNTMMPDYSGYMTKCFGIF